MLPGSRLFMLPESSKVPIEVSLINDSDSHVLWVPNKEMPFDVFKKVLPQYL